MQMTSNLFSFRQLYCRRVFAASARSEPLYLPAVVVKEAAMPSTGTPERQYSETQAREALERTPGGVELVGAEEIKESLGTNLQQVLDFVPGVLVQGRQGAASARANCPSAVPACATIFTCAG